MNTPQPNGNIEPNLPEMEQELAGILESLGKKFEATSVFASDQAFGKYRLQEMLACRGQAWVFRARDEQLNRDVVIKTYREQIADEKKSRAVREGQAMAKISSEHVAVCLGVEVIGSNPLLITEYVDGEPLDAYAKRARPSPMESLELVRQVARGLKEAHQQGVLHLDIKPSNVIVKRDGRATIIDFGLAQDRDLPAGDSSSGTPGFTAPELVTSGQPATEQTDVFGIGGLLYYLLAGSPPFPGKTKSESLEMARIGMVVSPTRYQSAIPPDLTKLCMHCLTPKLDHRIQSAEEFLRAATDLERLEEIRSRRAKRNRATLLLLVAASILATAVLWKPSTSEKPDSQSQTNIETNRFIVDALNAPESLEQVQFPNPLQLKVQLIDCDDERIIEFSNPYTLLHRTQAIELSVHASQECFAAVYSVQFSGTESDSPNSCILIPNGDKLLYRTERNCKIKLPRFSPSVGTEYFLIVAGVKEWSPKEFYRSHSQHWIEVETGDDRGLIRTPNNKQFSALAIPYRISSSQ